MNNYTGEALRVKEKDGLEAEDGGISWSLIFGKGQRGRGRTKKQTGTGTGGTKYLKNGSNKSKQHGLTCLPNYSKSYLTCS
jgi:hypothetical protein